MPKKKTNRHCVNGTMSDVFLLIIATAVADNIILTSMLGLCPFISLSKQMPIAVGVGVVTTFVLALSCAIAWGIHQLLPTALAPILPLLLITVIACIVQITELLMRLYTPKQHRLLGVFLPLIATNCAVLGSVLLILRQDPPHSLLSATIAGAGYGLGFLAAIVCLNGLRSRIINNAIPPALRGTPILMINAGIMALTFSAFAS